MKKTGKVVLAVVAVVIDLLVYILLGVAMMNYDDFYDGPQEKYGDWDTMATFDKYIFIAWVFWNIVNFVALACFVYFVIKKLRRSKRLRNSDF